MVNKIATVQTTMGTFTIELYTDTMPVTACEKFICLSDFSIMKYY